jgi:hypothetical protein
VAREPDGQELESAARAAEFLLVMIGAGSNPSDIDGCRNLVDGRGIDPAAVRQHVRDSVGAAMTPPPSRPSELEIEWAGDGGVARAPIWTEAGRSRLRIEITVQPRFYDSVAGRFWSCFVSGVIDEPGGAVLTPHDAPAPTSSPYPAWSEQRDQPSDDPRIPRGAFTGASYGIRLGQIVNGLRRVHPDVLDALDKLNEGQAAIVLLNAFFDELNGDGIDAAYQRLTVDGAPRRLTAAAELVGADAYADVFAQVEQSLPPGIRDNSTALRSHLEDRESAALDSGDEDTILRAYEDQIYKLEDEGNLIWHHMVRYVEHHPDQFLTASERPAGSNPLLNDGAPYRRL